jgi:hypothetical protein
MFVRDTCSAGARPERFADVLCFGVEPADARHREEQTERAGDQREQHALDEQLPDDLPAARADRHADADLRGPTRRAREQQVGHVGTRDEQHERDRAHQRPEHELCLRREDHRHQRFRHGRQILVRVGVRPRQLGADTGQFRARLFVRHAVTDSSEREVVPRLPRLLTERRRELRRREPDLLLLGEPEALRHDADDGRRHAVQANRRAEHAGIAAVSLLPHGVGQHHHRRPSGTIVAGAEIAPEDWRDADHLEVVRRNVGPRVLLRDAPLVAHVEGAAEDERHAGQRPRRGPPVVEVQERDAGLLAADVARQDHRQLFGFGKRHAPQEHGVDDGEDGVVGADSEGEDDHSREREPAVLQEEADCVPEVLEQAHGSSQGTPSRRSGRHTGPSPNTSETPFWVHRRQGCKRGRGQAGRDDPSAGGCLPPTPGETQSGT